MRERKAETRWKDTVVCPSLLTGIDPFGAMGKKKERRKGETEKRAVADAVAVGL